MTRFAFSCSANTPGFTYVAASAWCLALVLSARVGWCANVEVLYAPHDAPLDRVVMLYQHAKRYIYVSVYGLTSPRAVQALVAAKKRGVDVRMLTDQERTQERKQHTALLTLRLAGIPIRINQHEGLMHLKQVVIDDEINTSGSMNHTTSGNSYNDERMDIITDHAISLKAREQVLVHVERSCPVCRMEVMQDRAGTNGCRC